MRTSVVVVTWNSAEVIGGCLRSLAAHPPPDPWEVVVVDNGSRDATLEVVAGAAVGARVIANGRNRGLAAANNQGIRASTGTHLLICNPDVRFTAGAAAAMAGVLDRHPRAAWVVPRLRGEDGGLQTSAGDLPTLAQALLGRQVAGRRARGSPSGLWWDGWPHDAERVIGRGHEAAYLMRRDAVDQVGLQDERYRLDWEGFDWTARLRDAGWEVWLCPDAEVVHLGGDSIRQVPLRWLVSQHRGMYRYFADRRPRWQRPLLAGLVAARAATKAAGLATGAASYERASRAGAVNGPRAGR